MITLYGFNNGNPQYAGFPTMQNRVTMDNQYQTQQYYNRPQMPSYLKGRMVTSVDEAKASQFDLDGTITFFPSLAENKVYAKTLDNNGLPVFMQFVLQQEQPQQNNVLENLTHRIERLEKELGYDSNGTDANNANK